MAVFDLRTDSPMFLGGMGGTYAFVRAASANLREKDDPWNTAVAGFSAGALLGLRGEFYFMIREIELSFNANDYANFGLSQPALSPPFSATVLPLPLPWPPSITPRDFSDTRRTRRRMNSSAARSCARLTRPPRSRLSRNSAKDVVRQFPHLCRRSQALPQTERID